MSVTSYERLRILHRTLLQKPLAPTALRKLVNELPTYLDGIETSRPALQQEVRGCRDYVMRLRGYLANASEVDATRVLEGLHRNLGSLFG